MMKNKRFCFLCENTTSIFISRPCNALFRCTVRVPYKGSTKADFLFKFVVLIQTNNRNYARLCHNVFFSLQFKRGSFQPSPIPCNTLADSPSQAHTLSSIIEQQGDCRSRNHSILYPGGGHVPNAWEAMATASHTGFPTLIAVLTSVVVYRV